jgi:hypothetical protein
VVREAIDGSLEIVADENVGVGLDLADGPERAPQSPQKSELSRKSRGHAHLKLLGAS